MPRCLMLTVLLLVTIAIAGCGGPTARVEVTPDIANFKVKTVAILPFEGVVFTKETEEFAGWWKQNYTNNGEVISDMLATELIGTGGFTYIERSQIRKVLEEKGFSLAELVQKKSASDIGKLLGADAVVVGTIGKLCYHTTVIGIDDCNIAFSARMVHSETGAILWSASVNRQEMKRDVLDIARQECRRIADQLRAKLPSKPKQ